MLGQLLADLASALHGNFNARPQPRLPISYRRLGGLEVTDDKDDEIRELRARLEAIEARPKTLPVKRPMSGCLTFIIVAILGVVGLYVIGSIAGAIDEVETATGSTDWTPPDGFTPYRTDNGSWVAVEWSRPTRAECRTGGWCIAMNVVAKDACPRSLYASIKLLGEGGDNIGWTNDSAQGVDAGERVRLVFSTYEAGAKSAAIAEMSCY